MGFSNRDVGLNSIKVSFFVFKGESDPEAYLAWESSCDKIFQLNDLTEEKKSFYAIAHFEGYANTWWEYVKWFGNEMVGEQPPPWFRLKNLMRQRYLPETYRHELLAKLHNLRQGSKSVMAFYDEFQQLMLKLDHRGEQVSHDIVHFKVGLNKDISPRMTLYKFDTIDGIFHAALEVERELKENSFMAAQPEATKAVQKHPPRYEGKLNSTSNPKGFQCFKCREWGHKANECPNRRNINLRESILYYLGEEVGIESVKNDGKPQDGEQDEAEVQNEEYGEDVWLQEGDYEVP
ncbi:hypothetical protein P3S67_013322 [Capsicum chacoense]